MLVLASLFWAGNIVLARALHGDMPPVALTFWRWAVALLVLLPFTIGMARRQWPAIRREWKFLVLLGLTGMAVFHSLQYSALNLTTAVNVTLILAITPVVIPIMSRLIWGERLAITQGVGIVLSVAGVGAIVTRGDPLAALNHGLSGGDMVEVAAMLFWSLYSTLARRRPADLHPNVLLCASIVPAVLFTAPVYIWETVQVRAMPLTWQSVLLVGYIAVLASAVAFLFFNRAVEAVGPTRAGLFIHLVPLFATLAAVIFLDERLFAWHGYGALAILAGLLLTAAPGRSAARPTAD